MKRREILILLTLSILNYRNLVGKNTNNKKGKLGFFHKKIIKQHQFDDALLKWAKQMDSIFQELGYKLKKEVTPEQLAAEFEPILKKLNYTGLKTQEQLDDSVTTYRTLVTRVQLTNNTAVTAEEKPELTRNLLKNFMVNFERLRDDGTYKLDVNRDDFAVVDGKPVRYGTTEYVVDYDVKNDKDPFSNLFIANTGINGIILDKYTDVNFIMQKGKKPYSSIQADIDAPEGSRVLVITGGLAKLFERRTGSAYFDGLFEEITLEKFRKK